MEKGEWSAKSLNTLRISALPIRMRSLGYGRSVVSLLRGTLQWPTTMTIAASRFERLVNDCSCLTLPRANAFHNPGTFKY